MEKLKVDLTLLHAFQEFFDKVNVEDLKNIEWTVGGKIVEVSEEEIQEWKFTGLNNKDFGLFLHNRWNETDMLNENEDE